MRKEILLHRDTMAVPIRVGCCCIETHWLFQPAWDAATLTLWLRLKKRAGSYLSVERTSLTGNKGFLCVLMICKMSRLGMQVKIRREWGFFFSNDDGQPKRGLSSAIQWKKNRTRNLLTAFTSGSSS